VYSSTKRACIEGFSIRPNRCGIQYTRFHARNQVCNDEGFDFHVGHDTGVDASSFKPSFDPKNSRAERDDSRRFEGIIHIYGLDFYRFVLSMYCYALTEPLFYQSQTAHIFFFSQEPFNLEIRTRINLLNKVFFSAAKKKATLVAVYGTTI
jgi:hypothetical protein